MHDPSADLRAEVGRRLARRRRILGLTQDEVAARLGTQRSQVSQLERGHFTAINIDHLRALSEVLQTSIDYLLVMTDEEGYIPPRSSSGTQPPEASSAASPAHAG